MRPDEAAALEDTAWQAFVQRLADLLAGQWPAMPDRLGDRYPAFIDLAVQQAGEQGLLRAASVARFVNLWFVWGPAYHERPGFEWAQAILAAGRGGSAMSASRDWLTVHQLVQRSLTELQHLPGARIAPQALAAADAHLIAAFGAYGRQGRLHPPEPPPAPQTACDLEAADIRVLDDSGPLQYRLDPSAPAGDWQRSAVALPAALRVDASRAVPKLIAMLSNPPGQGPQARLQVRVRPRALCHGDVHPLLGFSGPHGRWVWTGHESKSASWPVAARDPPLPRAGPGSAMAEETSPELQRLEIEVCGLRDDGEPIGPLQTLVSVWPAAQWWLELQRAAPETRSVLPGPRAWLGSRSRCRIERDGLAQDAAPLQQHFEAGLDGAVALGLQKLAAACDALPGLSAVRLDALLGLLVGQASLTWGWAYGPGGLDGPALMRVVARLDLNACLADLQLAGELTLMGTRSRLMLRLAGQAALRQTLQHDTPTPPLSEVMLAVVTRWRFPVELTLDPLANDAGSLLQLAGPATGALVGEAGLRPCTRGCSGWEWFVGLRLEPVSVPLRVIDPLLGQQTVLQPLLPALTLVDWSLG
jgi:hypothetical protein